MVVCVHPDFFQVIVFSADAQAFLRVGYTAVLRCGISKYNILELVHTRVGEHQRWIIFDYHWCRRHDLMFF